MRGLDLRRGTAALACMAAALLGATAIEPASATPDGMAWGAYPSPRGTETDQQAILRMERDSGRKMEVVRDFLLWDDPFPESLHTWLADTDRTMILSVRAVRADRRTPVRWADIAAAQPGDPLYADMVRWADRIKALGVPVYFSFNHEPETETNLPMGVAPEFIAAWRKFHSVFAARNVTNVRFMWIMTDYSFFASLTDRRHASKWYPGDDYVHALGADAYNWFTCRPAYQGPWKSLETIIEPFRDFGAAHPAEELWLAEWASVEDPARPGHKAEWINAARELFKRPSYAQFHGVAYFDSYKYADCPWPVETSPSSLEAFEAMGADPFYAGTDAPAAPLGFVASASQRGSRSSFSVQLPASVRAGDSLLLFFTSSTNLTVTPPTGWTTVDAVNPQGLRGRAWSRTATASDAGGTVTVRASETAYGDLTVAAYRGTATSPVDVHAVAVDTTSTSRHIAPSVTPAQAGDWVVVFWADKSSANTGHTIPGTLTKRRTSAGSGTAHITATLADSGRPVPAGATGVFPATGAANASRAVMYTIALRPR